MIILGHTKVLKRLLVLPALFEREGVGEKRVDVKKIVLVLKTYRMLRITRQ